MRSSETELRFNAASGTSARTLSATCRRPTRKHGVGNFQRAYEETTYEAARNRLTDLHAELQQINRKAARSLQEGLEETLTLHQLGLFDELGKSLKTTNCIESLMGDVGEYIDGVKRSCRSPQRHQWMALAVLEAENGFRRLFGVNQGTELILGGAF
jgi:transposase-like protein